MPKEINCGNEQRDVRFHNAISEKKKTVKYYGHVCFKNIRGARNRRKEEKDSSDKNFHSSNIT